MTFWRTADGGRLVPSSRVITSCSVPLQVPLPNRLLPTRAAPRLYEKSLESNHPYLAMSLNNLAGLYQAQGRYAEAEPLYERALTIFEKALGPERPDVATALENYAALPRETGRSEDAREMEARAKAVRAKHAAENP